MIEIEFWPDYDRGPLWTDGREVPPEDLNVPASLAERLRTWNALYEEWKIPIDGEGDELWLAEGRRLLHELRGVLSQGYEVGVNEDWWDS